MAAPTTIARATLAMSAVIAVQQQVCVARKLHRTVQTTSTGASYNCLGVSCYNGGCCYDTGSAGVCICATEYTGTDCSTIVDCLGKHPNTGASSECGGASNTMTAPCAPGGICEAGIGTYRCICWNDTNINTAPQVPVTS
ncbi:unnamed protein product [Sphagnum balticum]